MTVPMGLPARPIHRANAAAVLLFASLIGAVIPGVSLGQPVPPPAGGAPPMRQVVPARSDAPLVNPGMGLYLYGTLDAADLPPDAWFSPLVQIGYFRQDWSILQPEGPGNRLFDAYFGPIFDLWVKRWNRRVAFRFMSENMHSRSKYVTPKWVFDQGVPSVTLKGLYGNEQIDPVFWDERYLAIQERFIAELGKYLDGRPGLEFVDIGAIGEWGEMHLARWTPELLEKTGFTTARYIAAHRRLIDAFARAFLRTRVFLNVGDYEAINDYAALRGLHFRQDGLTPHGPSADVGNRFFRPYAPRGVVCNYELHSGYDDMKRSNWGVRETFAKGLEDPISYMHINLMDYRRLAKAPDDVRAAVTDAARRVGFRFVLTKLRCNQTLRLGEQAPARLLLEHTWKNEGVAPCYASYALRWTLVDSQGRIAAEQLSYPKRPTTAWRPGEEVALTDVVSIPAGAAPGQYRLKVAMVEPENPAVCVQLAIGGGDAQGRYDLCSLPAVRREAAVAVVYDEGFERTTGNWAATEGMAVRIDADAHAGKGCLLISGVQPGNAWNYAGLSLQRPVLAASRYRLSCWMRVDTIAPKAPAPYLKIGLSDVRGKWLSNIQTNAYDLAKLGTWQRLVALVETTPETAGGHLAVEKGSHDARMAATIRLDDVRLELLESP